MKFRAEVWLTDEDDVRIVEIDAGKEGWTPENTDEDGFEADPLSTKVSDQVLKQVRMDDFEGVDDFEPLDVEATILWLRCGYPANTISSELVEAAQEQIQFTDLVGHLSQDQRHLIVSALVRMADDDEENAAERAHVKKIRDLADLFRPVKLG